MPSHGAAFGLALAAGSRPPWATSLHPVTIESPLRLGPNAFDVESVLGELLSELPTLTLVPSRKPSTKTLEHGPSLPGTFELNQTARTSRAHWSSVRPYLWWWALLLAVLIVCARFGLNGTTRTIVEIAAVVLFLVAWFVGAVIRLAYLREKERRTHGK